MLPSCGQWQGIVSLLLLHAGFGFVVCVEPGWRGMAPSFSHLDGSKLGLSIHYATSGDDLCWCGVGSTMRQTIGDVFLYICAPVLKSHGGQATLYCNLTA